jgi:DHA2 family multidrug resistance protein
MAAASLTGNGPVSAGKPSHRPLAAVIAVLLGSFLSNVDTRAFTLALPDLRGAFSLGFDQGAWLSTAATASQILVAPAVAWLATVLGLRRILGIPALIFAAVCLAIPLAHNYPTLLALNILHGMLLGTFVPATLMIVFRNLPVEWWLAGIAIYALRVGFAQNSGISLVGLYVDGLGWEWLFWQDVIVAPLMALFVYLGTPQETPNRALLSEADWGGMLLLGSGMAMLYAGLDQGNRLNWLESGTVIALLAAGTGLIVIFLVNEVVVRQPWAHFSVLLNRNIGLSLILILLYVFTSLSSASLAPNFLITVAELRPEQIGPTFLCYAGLPMLVWLPLSILLMRRMDARILVILGMVSFALSAFLGTGITHEWAPGDFAPMIALQSFGHVFTLAPLIVVALCNLDLSRSTGFGAYVQVVRLGGAEIGTALMATWIRMREQVHSNLLGQHVTESSDPVAGMTAHLASLFRSDDVAAAPARAVATLAALVRREANTLAYIDGFWLTAWFAVIALFLAVGFRASPAGRFLAVAKP